MSSFFGSPKIGIKLDDRPETVLKLYDQTKLEHKGTVAHHTTEISKILNTINKHIQIFDLVAKHIIKINRVLKEKSTKLSANNVVEQIDILEEIIGVLKEESTALTTQDSEVVTHLYKINAFYEEFVLTPKSRTSGYYELAFFPTFRENYVTYRTGISRFTGKTSISIVANMDVLKEQDISKLRDKTAAIIEKVYTRILFYQYSTLHNHYLSILYMMYAVRQLRLLDNGLSLLGKQTDYKYVDEMLTSLLDNDKTLPSGTKELIQKQADSLKLSLKNNDDLKTMKKTAKEKIMGGAESPIESKADSVLQRLIGIYHEKKNIYEESNTALASFFLGVNDAVSVKAEEFVNIHLKYKTYIKGNIRAPLARVVSDIEMIDNGKDKDLYTSNISDLHLKNHLETMMIKVEDNAKATLEAIGNSGNMAPQATQATQANQAAQATQATQANQSTLNSPEYDELGVQTPSYIRDQLGVTNSVP
jgi:hypothetical protein